MLFVNRVTNSNIFSCLLSSLVKLKGDRILSCIGGSSIIAKFLSRLSKGLVNLSLEVV